MKKTILLLALCSFLISSCFTTHYIAAPNQSVKLAPKGSACTLVSQKRLWYALWGFIAISDIDTAQLVEGIKGSVKLEDQVTFLDLLIGFFTQIVTIRPKTVKVYSCQ